MGIHRNRVALAPGDHVLGPRLVERDHLIDGRCLAHRRLFVVHAQRADLNLFHAEAPGATARGLALRQGHAGNGQAVIGPAGDIDRGTAKRYRFEHDLVIQQGRISQFQPQVPDSKALAGIGPVGNLAVGIIDSNMPGQQIDIDLVDIHGQALGFQIIHDEIARDIARCHHASHGQGNNQCAADDQCR